MNLPIALAISMIVLTVFCFLFFFVFGSFHFKSVKAKKLDILTDFPFETNEGRSSYRLASIIFLICFALTLVYCGSFFAIVSSAFPYLTSVFILLCGLAVLKGGFLIATSLIPAHEVKSHMIFFSLYGAFFVLFTSLSAISFWKLRQVNDAAGIAFFVILLILALVDAGLLLNPKLSHWPDMKSVQEKDGTITLVRPRPFVLAFTEWLLIILDLIASLSAVVGLFICWMSLI